MYVDVTYLSLDGPADIFVCIFVHVWGKTCLDADLCCTKCLCLLCTPYYFVCRQKISFLLAKIPAKCTKAALLYADICKVDVSIDYVCYNIANTPFSKLVCNHPHKMKVKTLCMKQPCSLAYRNFLFL